MRLSPASPVCGIRVEGLDVRDLTAADQPRFVDLLHDNKIVVVPGQTLAPDDLLRFGSMFGLLQHHVLQQFTLPGYPQLFVLSNEVVDGRPLGHANEGFGWHTDMSYMRQPTAYTMLYALKVPAVGGATWFTDTQAAWDALPEERKALVRGRFARFSYGRMYGARTGATPLTPEQRARTPDILHPIVRRHPVTGRHSLYLGGIEVAGVSGMADEDGVALMKDLLAFATRPERVFRHEWKPGDLVIWDNRGLLHTATEYDRSRYTRTLYRTSIEGEVPLGWAA